MSTECIESEILQSPCVKPKHSRRLRTQLIMAGIIGVSYISCGMSIGHSAVLLPELRKNGSDINIDDDTASLIASIYALMGPLGGLTAGLTMELWGRKCNNIIASIGFTIGWVLLAAAQNSSVIVYGRAIEGFFRTSLLTTIPVQTDETADPWYRGNILGFHSIAFMAGIMLMSSFGALVHWRTVCILSTLISGVSAFLIFFSVESPSWLVRRNRIRAAENSLLNLWGSGQQNQANQELESLKIRYLSDIHKQNRLISKNRWIELVELFKTLLKPNLLKPFIIMHIFSTIQVICGLYVFVYYSIDIISRTRRQKDSVIDDNVANVCISSIRMISIFVHFLCTFRIGRRAMAIISGAGSSASLIPLSAIIFLRENNKTLLGPQTEEWTAFLLLLMYVSFSTFGFIILPTVMIGETQNSRVRGFVYAYIFAVNDILLGVVLNNYYIILETLKLYGLILLFGVSCLVCTIFVYLFLPETRGKSLEQIEDYFKQPNILWSKRIKPEKII